MKDVNFCWEVRTCMFLSSMKSHLIKQMQTPFRPFARWRHFTTTTRILHNFAGITEFKYERKNEKDSGHSSKITPSCKWPTEIKELVKISNFPKFFFLVWSFQENRVKNSRCWTTPLQKLEITKQHSLREYWLVNRDLFSEILIVQRPVRIGGYF